MCIRDSYTGGVFEMFDRSPENPRAMFGGGRYDNLVGLFGKHQLSGVGFGWGDVTMRNFLETHDLLKPPSSNLQVFVTLPEKTWTDSCEQTAHALRNKGLSVATPLSIGSFSQQLKLAHKLGAQHVLLFGEDEDKQGKYGLKTLATGQQQTLTLEEVVQVVRSG